jgi:hypothetical protein
VQVTTAFDPPWKAKVSLGSFWAVGGMEQLVVSYWVRAERTEQAGAALPSPRADVTDIDAKYGELSWVT